MLGALRFGEKLSSDLFLSPLVPPPGEEPHCHPLSSGAPAFSARPPGQSPPISGSIPSQPLLVSRLRLATLSSGASEATPKDRRSGQPGSGEDRSMTASLLESSPSHSKAPAPRRPVPPGVLGASLRRARSVPDSSRSPEPGRRGPGLFSPGRRTRAAAPRSPQEEHSPRSGLSPG